MTSLKTELRDGVNHVLPKTLYKLSMQHPSSAEPVCAWSVNFDNLNDLRIQLENLNYKLIGISA